MQIPKPSEGGTFTPCPPGTYTATCFRFIDLGSHESEYQGQKKTRHEVLISWELSDELMDDGRPFTVNKRYTWSMNEKSTLRHHLEAWRGKAFTNEEFSGANAFDTKNLLGKPCTITITQETKQDGTQISKVSGVGKAMKGVVPPPLQNAAQYLALTPDRFDPTVLETLGEYYKTLITSSPEYRDLLMRRSPGPVPAPSSYDTPDDDIPF